MVTRRTAIFDGDRQLRWTSRRFGDDFRELRLRHGLRQANIAAAIGVDRSVITRIERGDVSVSSAIRSRAAACLGADFRIALYPERAPLLFDAAHTRVLERVVKLTHPSWRRAIEVPVPGPGRRSVDLRLERGGDIVLLEVETRVRRLEEIIRETHSKREAFLAPGRSSVHVVLALPPTRHHRAIAREAPGLLRAAFPISSTALRAALQSRSDRLPGDGILWVSAGSERVVAATE